ncbi:MAG TPA: hypothetical protein VMO47_15525 [Rhodothermales bacterium]|nr:hypothetical protein [Rhodothermales bacterium]
MRLVYNTQRRLAPWLIALVLPLVAAISLKAQQLEVLINEGVQNWGLAVDRSSNVFVARSLQGTETLGAGQSGEVALTSAGGVDLSIAKYDASGQLLWARDAGGPGTDIVEIIETDAEGNIYLAGTWAGAQNTAITFGAGTPSCSELCAYCLRGDALHLTVGSRSRSD